jgi:hypothetical protein
MLATRLEQETSMRPIAALVLGFGVLIAGLSGCSGGGGDDGGGGGLPTGPLTVTARVINLSGLPIANAAVWISGHGPFATDGNGEVTVPDMPSTYEALIVDTSTGTNHFWPALTRPDPVFTMNAIGPPVDGEPITGHVTGGVGWPVPPSHNTDVHFVYHAGFGFSVTDADPATGEYSFGGASWFGPLTTSATFYAFQYLADVNGDPVSFTGFGSLAIPLLTPNTVITNPDIGLAPVPTSTITGMVNLPPGMTSIFQFVRLRPAAGSSLMLPGTETFLPTIMSFAPVVPGLARDLLVFAATGLGELCLVVREDLPDPAPNLMIDVPEPTGLFLPVQGALDVDHGTPFQVTATPGGRVFTVRFSPSGNPGPSIVLHTTESTFTIPDLSAYGITIPPGSNYEWSVAANGPLASLDEAAVPTTLVSFVPIVSNGSGDAFVFETVMRSFTFAQ